MMVSILPSKLPRTTSCCQWHIEVTGCARLHDAVQWAWQFVGWKQLAANQRVHYDDLDLDPDKHTLQAERITNK